MSIPLLVTGAGGVGKTTISAAVAIRAAEHGLRTLVLTVDPARRLAAALGLDELGNEPRAHDSLPTLSAAMLDAESSWAEIARRHAKPDVAERLVHNEFFSTITRHFPASQSYAAAETMADYLEANKWDVVVVDTPPSAGGIEFFTAPTELTDLIGGRLFRWITGGSLPGRRELFNLAARPALRIVDTALGSDLLERVTVFLFDLRTTYDGLRRRAGEIDRHFRRAITLVVTTSDPAPVAEAARFYRSLPEIAKPPRAVVFNRALPASWEQAKAPRGADQALVANLERWSREATHQRRVRSEFSARYGTPVVTVPWTPVAPTTLKALSQLIDGVEGLRPEALALA